MCSAICRKGKEDCRLLPCKGNVFYREPANHVPELYNSTVWQSMAVWRRHGVRYPKYIWAPCAQLYSLAETLHPPPPHLDSYRGRYWSVKIDDISL
jgi:hypothetical protein